MNQVYAARDAAGSAAVDLQPGQQQLSVTVTVEWSFD
jgi:uncharacterized protein YggE